MGKSKKYSMTKCFESFFFWLSFLKTVYIHIMLKNYHKLFQTRMSPIRLHPNHSHCDNITTEVFAGSN